MSVLFVVLVTAVVVAVVALFAWTLYEMSPFAHHSDSFHGPGQRQQSPRLD
jgi:hypothetical protein